MTENFENNLYFLRHLERSRHAVQSKDLSCPAGSFDCGLRPPLRMTAEGLVILPNALPV